MRRTMLLAAMFCGMLILTFVSNFATPPVYATQPSCVNIARVACSTSFPPTACNSIPCTWPTGSYPSQISLFTCPAGSADFTPLAGTSSGQCITKQATGSPGCNTGLGVSPTNCGNSTSCSPLCVFDATFTAMCASNTVNPVPVPKLKQGDTLLPASCNVKTG
jgi:hypothetical protein